MVGMMVMVVIMIVAVMMTVMMVMVVMVMMAVSFRPLVFLVHSRLITRAAAQAAP